MKLSNVIVASAFLWTLTGCAGGLVGTTPKPPVAVAPRPEESPNIEAWVRGVYDAYVRNCITLMILRGEEPSSCDVVR